MPQHRDTRVCWFEDPRPVGAIAVLLRRTRPGSAPAEAGEMLPDVRAIPNRSTNAPRDWLRIDATSFAVMNLWCLETKATPRFPFPVNRLARLLCLEGVKIHIQTGPWKNLRIAG